MKVPLPAAAAFRRRLLAITAILGALTVVAGAFGAHALSTHVAARMLDVWATAVRYQMWHVLALLAAVALAEHLSLRVLRVASYAWIAGMVIFSGSLYLLVLTRYSALGALTPFGGVLLIAGWLLFASAAWRGIDANADQ